jgi:hypothetical protein
LNLEVLLYLPLVILQPVNFVLVFLPLRLKVEHLLGRIRQ